MIAKLLKRLGYEKVNTSKNTELASLENKLSIKNTQIFRLLKIHEKLRENGITGNNLKQILVGAWNGEKASNVMNEIINDLKQKLQNKGE